MELFTAGALGTIGYLFSQNEKYTSQISNDNNINKNEKPVVDHVYSGKQFNKTQEEVIRKVNKKYNKSLQPFENKVISNNMKHIKTNKHIHSRLADVDMEPGDFKHNNMVPFFGSKMTQVNVDNNRMQSKLDTFTGTGNFYKKKKEVENFADIKQNVNNIAGQENTLEFQKTRYVESKYVTNTLPFVQEKIGPGLNQDYGTSPKGGFQQIDTRQFELPKNVDELRQASNPKSTYDGRVVDGQKEILPGDIGEVCKNLVDTTYAQTEDMYLKSGNSSNSKEAQRPCINLKQTNRSDLTVKTHQTNLTSTVKSITAPLLDIMRVNKKEYTIMHGRPMGNLQNTNPSKITVYDPNNVARTTIKETLIHNSRTGNIKGYEKNIVYDPNDVARTTMKETTESKGKTGNVGNLQNSDAYKNIKVDMKTTDRQITSDNQYYGVGGSAADKQMLYDDKYNATINEVRDILLKERKPTKTSVKLYNEIDNTHLNPNKSKLECDQHNTRQTGNLGRVMNEIPDRDRINVTKDRTVYKNDASDRISPGLLDAFNSNPYSQPLNSF
jgi:hypothetical protein|tara:strand:- start:608 stop:2269 length:1662 start_codon:yes stop_codon:yes gene_type:complete